MIISHKHRFIFIKNLKVAGTSMMVQLAKHCGPDDVVSQVDPPIPGHEPRNINRIFYNHMFWWEMVKHLDRAQWRSYYKFCVERNPWDKTVSRYFYDRVAGNVDPEMSMDEFLERRMPLDGTRYRDINNRPVVDKIIKYENLNEELGEVCDHVGIPWDGRLRFKAKQGDVRPHYSRILTARQANIIGDAFSWEIENLGYEY